MERIVAPNKYMRQAGILTKAGPLLVPLGRKAFITGGERALAAAGEPLLASLETMGVKVSGPHWYGGQCSQTKIDALADKVEDADFIVGVGGGRALDTAKALAYEVKLPVVTVPTSAATCAASTPLAAIYSDENVYLELSPRAANPTLALVDSQVIATAPHRLLASGLGDTLAKWFEVDATLNLARADAGALAAHTLARFIYDILQTDGGTALAAAREGAITPPLERVIDTIILLSGCVSGLGGIHCRTAAAHAIYSGLTIFPAVHNRYHGEIVAFGVLAQALLENRPLGEIEGIIAFNLTTGLPVTMADLGLAELSQSQWQTLGTACVRIPDMANMPFPVSPAMVIEALQQTAELVNKTQQNRK